MRLRELLRFAPLRKQGKGPTRNICQKRLFQKIAQKQMLLSIYAHWKWRRLHKLQRGT